MSTQTMNTGAADTATTPAPEGHDAAMAARFDASQTTPTTETVDAPKAERPAHIPEKFWKDGAVDVDALAASYAELEKAKSTEKKPEGETPKAPADVAPEAAGEASPEQAADALASVGLDYNAISERYQTEGKLADADRQALNKAGVPDAMIDAYVAGQQAVADAYVTSIKDAAGGAEEFSRITQWAAKGLPAAEINAFNKAMDGKDVEAAKLAVAGLKSRYEAANGQEPQLQRGGTGPASVGDVFLSNEELVTAMRDPRYRQDPGYRNSVIQKLNRSSIM
jgi:hypothetical protein